MTMQNPQVIFASAGVTLAAANAWTAAQTFSAGIILPAGGDITFTGTTGTNDIVLVNALADALSITDGSADILVIDTSTSGNVATFTAAVNLSGTLDAESYAAIGNGEALDADNTLIVNRDFTVASGVGSQLRVDGVITAASGQDVFGAEFRANLTTPSSSTNAIVAQVLIAEPTITEGDTVTTGVSLYVADAPTEGANNYALWVDAGAVQIDETLVVGGILQVNGRGGVRAIEVPLNDFVVDQGSPAYGNASSVVAWAFDDGADERIQASFTVPEDFVSGGGIRVFYIMASATSGAVEVEANITAAAEGENFDAVTGQVTVVDTVPGTAGLLATITNTTGTYAANDRVNILVKRDADGGSDDATGDMYLVGVQFVYVSDS